MRLTGRDSRETRVLHAASGRCGPRASREVEGAASQVPCRSRPVDVDAARVGRGGDDGAALVAGVARRDGGHVLRAERGEPAAAGGVVDLGGPLHPADEHAVAARRPRRAEGDHPPPRRGAVPHGQGRLGARGGDALRARGGRLVRQRREREDAEPVVEAGDREPAAAVGRPLRCLRRLGQTERRDRLGAAAAARQPARVPDVHRRVGARRREEPVAPGVDRERVHLAAVPGGEGVREGAGSRVVAANLAVVCAEVEKGGAGLSEREGGELLVGVAERHKLAPAEPEALCGPVVRGGEEAV
mmetsp:Transcript_13427/g.40191  ORF Transcript_13427/g.40191 Transcript_13427/m.40191 type:complete len:301 (+) Transcript_13427:279-1181(+)